MPDVEVLVYQDGTLIDRITRPLRAMPDGSLAVKFRRELHRYIDGAIYLGVSPKTALSGDVSGTTPISDDDDEEVGPGSWHRLQRSVIEARPHERLIVDAGPGTGKTQVACARVAHLIAREGLNPSAIWLISFTRTAVAEMRNRIVTALGDEIDASAVRISTLDSHAWSLYSGFNETAALTGSYDINIERALDLIDKDDLLADHLETVEHLIVDEAQDLVGIRAELISVLVGRLPQQCGVTVFSDEAQAIYGFADDDELASGTQVPRTLLRKLRTGGFESRSLTRIFRTSSKGLRKIFTETRNRLLSMRPDEARCAEVRNDIIKYADGELPAVENQNLGEAHDTLVLFRKRAEVLLASSFLMGNQIRVRVRMSGLPSCLWPWIGVCLSDHDGAYLSRSDFHLRWEQRIEPDLHGQVTEDHAWSLLYETAGKSRNLVEMPRLRSFLGRAKPPAAFCTAELGTGGPVLGTIHASKGREARTVHLMLPAPEAEESAVDHDEEARVLFVGATRAREYLGIGRGYTHHRAQRLSSGRAYHPKHPKHPKGTRGRVQIEIGHDGDVTAPSLAGCGIYSTPDEVHEIQRNLQRLRHFPIRAEAEAGPAPTYAYRLRSVDSRLSLGAFADRVNKDLFEVGDAMHSSRGEPRRYPPRFLNHLYIVGIRTVVLPPDHGAAEELHEPWRRSGILLAPVVLAYTTLSLPAVSGAK